MKPNFESSLSEENKRDRKNGLYRFKDDIEGDKDLKNLNMLYLYQYGLFKLIICTITCEALL